MSKFIGYVEMSYGERKYVTKIDKDNKTVETSSAVENAILFTEDLKPTVKRYARKIYPSNYFKLVKLEKFDDLLIPIDNKVKALYEEYNGWDMVDWKNGTEEPVIMGREVANSEEINDIETFDEFTGIVAKKIGEKNNLEEKG